MSVSVVIVDLYSFVILPITSNYPTTVLFLIPPSTLPSFPIPFFAPYIQLPTSLFPFASSPSIYLTFAPQSLTPHPTNLSHHPYPCPHSCPCPYSCRLHERFEHVMDETGSGGDGAWKLHLLLSRMLEVLHRFPGCVVLLVNVDQPQNISLQVYQCSDPILPNLITS